MSAEAKWTSGPLRVEDDGPCGSLELYSGEKFILTKDHQWDVEVPDEEQANAHLIAAAPELYAALEEARAWMWRLDNATPMDCGAQCETLHLANKMVDAALAKARGEAA